MPDTIYPLVVARMSDEDILDALQHNEKYVDDMLLALLDGLEKRNLTWDGAETLRAEIAARFVPVVEKATEEEIIEPIQEEIPVLYSQTAILAFTIFLSPLFGGILLALNVQRVRKKSAWLIVGISLLLSIACYYSLTYLMLIGSMAGILIPVVCGLLLSELIWNRFIGKGVKYFHRSIMIPLIIAVVLVGTYVYLMNTYPETFKIETQIANE